MLGKSIQEKVSPLPIHSPSSQRSPYSQLATEKESICVNYVSVGRTPAFSLQNSQWDSLRRPRWSLADARPARTHGRPMPRIQPQTEPVPAEPADELADLDPERWDGLA